MMLASCAPDMIWCFVSSRNVLKVQKDSVAEIRECCYTRISMMATGTWK